MNRAPTDTEGRIWHAYECYYHSSDGMFKFYISALSEDHARQLLDELKKSAEVKGAVLSRP